MQSYLEEINFLSVFLICITFFTIYFNLEFFVILVLILLQCSFNFYWKANLGKTELNISDSCNLGDVFGTSFTTSTHQAVIVALGSESHSVLSKDCPLNCPTG